jgi:hypothetical protein
VNPLENARKLTARARDALAAAERTHSDAAAREDATVKALDAAGNTYGDEPSEENAAKVRAARETRELAALATSGALRRLESARAALAAAERDENAAALAAASPIADRGALFDRVAAHVQTIASCDAIPRVDVYTPATASDLEVALREQLGRDIARAHACRAIRREMGEHVAAVAEVKRAAAALGQQAPHVASVPEAHVMALAAAETIALRAPERIDGAGAEWIAIVSPLIVSSGHSLPMWALAQEANEVFHSAKGRPDMMVEWARIAYRAGDKGPAHKAIKLAVETPNERELREHNERIARASRETDRLAAHTLGHGTALAETPAQRARRAQADVITRNQGQAPRPTSEPS